MYMICKNFVFIYNYVQYLELVHSVVCVTCC